MSPQELNWILSLSITVIGSLLAVSVWFVKRYVGSQDDNNKEFDSNIEKLKNGAVELEKLCSGFSAKIEFKLQSLDLRAEEWTESLESLTFRSNEAANALFKMEVRLESVASKLLNIEEQATRVSERLAEVHSSVGTLSQPMNLVRSEFEKNSKLITAIVLKLRSTEEEIKTIKLNLGSPIKR